MKLNDPVVMNYGSQLSLWAIRATSVFAGKLSKPQSTCSNPEALPAAREQARV